MSLRHHNWLNSQASRRYPLDDNGTATGDDGTPLNDDIILDLYLCWPSTAGQYAFIGGITVTATIVTVVILAADSPTAATDFTPLAAVTIRQPANEYSYYSFEPLYPGAGGFIAFGDVTETFSIRFSSPQQSLLTPKTCRPYTELPIPSMRKAGRVDGLTGLVKLVAGTDIEIVTKQVTIEDDVVDAVVIRLIDATADRNPLAEYIGPCGKRPESQNCDRTGIQTINGVTPDCDGNLEIEFRNLTAANYAICGATTAGIAIDQELGLSDVCPSRTPNRFQGDDYCNPSSESSVALPPESSGSVDPPGSEGSQSSEAVVCEELPFSDCFLADIHPSWSLKLGLQQVIVTDIP